jgi:hypothetical protein
VVLRRAAGGRASVSRRLQRAGTDDTNEHVSHQQVVLAGPGARGSVKLGDPVLADATG